MSGNPKVSEQSLRNLIVHVEYNYCEIGIKKYARKIKQQGEHAFVDGSQNQEIEIMGVLIKQIFQQLHSTWLLQPTSTL